MTLLMGFSSFNIQQTSKPNINGMWYHVNGGKYYDDCDRKDIARWYEFGIGGKVKYSSCTDMCGCMRATWSGTYVWESDSIIVVKFTKVKEDLVGSTDLEKAKIERLQITKIKGKGLQISKLKDE